MPNKAGRITPMEREFVKHMARTNDSTYAATKAGYKYPELLGARLRKKPELLEATRETVQAFLRDKGGAIGVYTLAELAIDEAQPGNTRRAAAKDLAILAGIGVTEDTADKAPSEMTPDELSRFTSQLRKQLAALESAKADQARPVIEHEEDIPKTDLFA